MKPSVIGGFFSITTPHSSCHSKLQEFWMHFKCLKCIYCFDLFVLCVTETTALIAALVGAWLQISGPGVGSVLWSRLGFHSRGATGWRLGEPLVQEAGRRKFLYLLLMSESAMQQYSHPWNYFIFYPAATTNFPMCNMIDQHKVVYNWKVEEK